MKVVSVVGARPNFIKLGPMSKALRRTCDEVIIHTGQHYDREMSSLLFEEMGIPAPDHNLGLGNGSVSEQTSSMLTGISKVILAEKPDLTVVYGDTTSTLAGALASLQAKVPCAHIEAGPRNRSMLMNELVNRVVVDRISTILLCATKGSMENLTREGLSGHFVGDHMYDAYRQYLPMAEKRIGLLEELGITSEDYYLATCHRAETTDDASRLSEVVEALCRLDRPVIFPVHPRTDKMLRQFGLMDRLVKSDNVIPMGPVGYLEALLLISRSRKVLTDSGGVQREAFFADKPCVVIFDESSWPEIVDAGWQRVAGPDADAIGHAIDTTGLPARRRPEIFGDGHASEKTMQVFENFDWENWHIVG